MNLLEVYLDAPDSLLWKDIHTYTYSANPV